MITIMLVFAFTESDDVTFINSNHSLHRMVKAKRVKALREYARNETAGMAPIGVPVSITATVHMPTARRFDPPNYWPTVKPLIDGMVDSGILTDDSSNEVVATTFVSGEKRPQRTIVLTMTPLN